MRDVCHYNRIIEISTNTFRLYTGKDPFVWTFFGTHIYSW